VSFVAPAYQARSLADVLPAVAHALGCGEALGAPPMDLELPDAPSYVLFLVDGLGFELLRTHAHRAPYLSSLLDGTRPATVSVPSTTATSLTTLGTALTPGRHGVVGFTSRIPGTNDLLNALMWSKDVDPHGWQPHPTAFARLAEAGVHTTMVNKREFKGSGLTDVSGRGAEFVGADRLGERLVAVRRASSRAPSLTYMYDGDLDWTGHRYGVDSDQWRAQLTAIDTAAQQLRDALPVHSRLLVVADHGMVDVPADRRIEVDDHPELRDGVALVGGEARFRHVYTRPGALGDVLAAWRGVIGERGEVLDKDEAFARGWFGEVDSGVRPRIGDVVVACRDDHAVMVSSAFPYEARLLGMHGSLTPVEMLVPLALD
jgi:Type I phosphodiesterase / nucleotide pyrophosphatase